MSTTIGRLIAHFEGNVSHFEGATKKVEAGMRRTARVSVSEEQRRAREVERIIAQTRRQADQQDRLRERSAKTLADVQIREAKRAARELEKQLAPPRTAKRGGGVGAFAAGAAGGLTALVGLSAVNEIRQAGSALIDYSSKLETTKIAFETMLGSSQRAADHLKELQAFALKTPFQFSELIDASQRMQALGIEAERVVPLLNDIGNAVAAAGGGSERLDRVTLALAQMQSKGRVATQELNQLAEAGISGWKILEMQLGKSRAELVKMVEKGEISSAVFIEAFQKFSQLNFGGLMEKQSRTFTGALANIKDAVLQLADEALKPTFLMIRDRLVGTAADLQNNKAAWQSWANFAADQMGRVLTGMGSVAAGVSDFVSTIARGFDRAATISSEYVNTVAGLLGRGDHGEADLWRPIAPIKLPDDLLKPIPIRPSDAVPSSVRMGGTGGGGKKGGAGTDPAATARRLAEINLRIVLDNLSAEEEGLKHSLGRRLISFEEYVLRTNVLESERHRDVIAGLTGEMEAATKLRNASQRQVAVREVENKLNQESLRHKRAIQDTEDETWRITETVSDAIKAQSKAISESIRPTNSWMQSVNDLKESLAKEGAVLDPVIEQMMRFNAVTAWSADVTDRAAKSFDAFMEEFGQLSVPDDEDLVNKQIADAINQAMGGELPPPDLSKVREQMRDLAGDLTDALDQSIYDGITGGMKRGLASLALGILDIVRNVFLRQLEEAIAQALMGIRIGGGGKSLAASLGSSLISGLLGGFGGGGNTWAAFGKNLGFPGRAMGGPVSPFQPYVVGERGPELFVPQTPGRVVSNSKVANTTINLNVTVPSPRIQTFRQQRSKRELAERIAGLVSA